MLKKTENNNMVVFEFNTGVRIFKISVCKDFVEYHKHDINDIMLGEVIAIQQFEKDKRMESVYRHMAERVRG